MTSKSSIQSGMALPSPKGKPTINGFLTVDDQIPEVTEGLPIGEPDVIPHGVRQRLGRDHQ